MLRQSRRSISQRCPRADPRAPLKPSARRDTVYTLSRAQRQARRCIGCNFLVPRVAVRVRMGVGSSASSSRHEACAGCHIASDDHRKFHGRGLRSLPSPWYLKTPSKPLSEVAPDGHTWDLKHCCDRCNMRNIRAQQAVVKEAAKLEQLRQEQHAAAVQAAQERQAAQRQTRSRAAAPAPPPPEPPKSVLESWMGPLLSRLKRSWEEVADSAPN